MVIEQHFGVVDCVLRAHKNEGHAAFFTRHRGLWLVVAFYFDSDHSRLVNNLLDESTVLTNDFTYKASGHLEEQFYIKLEYIRLRNLSAIFGISKINKSEPQLILCVLQTSLLTYKPMYIAYAMLVDALRCANLCF